jgi:peptide/nickel transport system ATP-binding protein
VVPSLLDPPPGCRFAPRCPAAIDRCTEAPPPLAELHPGHLSACIRARELAERGPEAIGLVRAKGEIAQTRAGTSGEPLLEVQGLTKHFVLSRGSIRFGDPPVVVRAVNDVDFAVDSGQTLGLVGESGCGKTTVGRLILRLEEATSGKALFEGDNLTEAGADALKKLRRKVQVIFQDPYSSLNPRMTVGEIIGEPLKVYGLVNGKGGGKERVAQLLGQVGLFPYMAERYPHELSGGQRQRVVIAGALVLDPELIVADEPVSNLDASVRGEILSLLLKLRDEMHISILIVTHDLGLAWTVADRVAVMYLGRIVESGPTEEVLLHPLHPYTRALLDVVPEAGGIDRPYLGGEPPDPTRIPPGCRFHPRCPRVADGTSAAFGVEERCRGEDLALVELRPGHVAACHLANVDPEAATGGGAPTVDATDSDVSRS